MKTAFLVLMIIHGVIHLPGFVKAFGLADVKQFKQAVSKPVGVLWLFASGLFIAAAIMVVFNTGYWWLVSLGAVVTSQILILLYWQDAKFGTILNVIFLMACTYGYATWNYLGKYQSDVKNSFQQTAYSQNSVLTEQDIAHLPEPVKKYLRYTGSVGKPRVNNFRIEFIGKIRKDEQSEWMQFASEQHNFMETPARLFFMKAVMKHLPVAGYHRYTNGSASMDIRLFSLFRVQFQDGDEMNNAETVTFFNDMCCMAPPTLIDKRIKWEDKGHNVVKAMFTNSGITITADLFFNEEGQLINFKSDDRYNADVGQQLPWATPLKNYKEINGYKLAGYAETIYTYPDRELCYGIFETRSVEYNRNDN